MLPVPPPWLRPGTADDQAYPAQKPVASTAGPAVQDAGPPDGCASVVAEDWVPPRMTMTFPGAAVTACVFGDALVVQSPPEEEGAVAVHTVTTWNVPVPR